MDVQRLVFSLSLVQMERCDVGILPRCPRLSASLALLCGKYNGYIMDGRENVSFSFEIRRSNTIMGFVGFSTRCLHLLYSSAVFLFFLIISVSESKTLKFFLNRLENHAFVLGECSGDTFCV